MNVQVIAGAEWNVFRGYAGWADLEQSFFAYCDDGGKYNGRQFVAASYDVLVGAILSII